jgi:hypothetical protein
MIEELTKYPYYDTEQNRNVQRTTLEYLYRRMYLGPYTIIDIGQRSPLTDAVEREFGSMIWNTLGDLDERFGLSSYPPASRCPIYYILYSHTIEHQFNPLFTILELKKYMIAETRMFIILPRRGKLLWWKGHYHEIDDYRMRLLLRRAGLDIVSFERHKVWREWWFYLTGIRPLLRLFCEYNAYYEVKINEDEA